MYLDLDIKRVLKFGLHASAADCMRPYAASLSACVLALQHTMQSARPQSLDELHDEVNCAR
jgi:hypothetical protein